MPEYLQKRTVPVHKNTATHPLLILCALEY